MLSLPKDPEQEARVTLSEMNFGSYPMVNGRYRIAARFYDEEAPIAAARSAIGKPFGAAGAGMAYDPLGLRRRRRLKL